VATRKQHLAALRHYFDGLVSRHAIILNPALSVRGERYEVVEGKTPEITVEGARKLLASIGTADPVELRDRAIVTILIYTASRARRRCQFKTRQFLSCRRAAHAALRREERQEPRDSGPARLGADHFRITGCGRAARKDTPLFRTWGGQALSKMALQRERPGKAYDWEPFPYRLFSSG
jgi:integrase/recombinase XerD